MSTGVHGSNGLNPRISYKIYQIYVIPRLLYGLEVLPLNVSNIDCLRRFHQNSLRRFQSLPPRTATSVLHLLLGALPLAAERHKRQLSLLYSVLSCDNDVITNLLQRQAAVTSNCKSFFSRVGTVLNMYSLPSIQILQTALPPKSEWKRIINSAMSEYWTHTFREDLATKSTVKYMNITSLSINTVHPTWAHLDSSVSDVRKGITRARMMTGTYYMQINKHKFSNCAVDPTCQLCRIEDEDIVHIITRCPALNQIRKLYIPKIKAVLQNLQYYNCVHQMFISRESLTQFIPGQQLGLNQ